MISCPAAKGMRWVKPSSATWSPSLTYCATASCKVRNSMRARISPRERYSHILGPSGEGTWNFLTSATRYARLSAAMAAGSRRGARMGLRKRGAAWPRSQKLEDTRLGWRFVNPLMRERYGTDTMAETAENVAAECRVSRADQDAFALRSQQRCATASAAGCFAHEITPVSVPGKGVVERDEHPRPDTTREALAQVPPRTTPDGTVTAGDASGVHHGAGRPRAASESAPPRPRPPPPGGD